MEKAFVSWSGGKDCCLALYRALQAGWQVRYLINMVTEDGERSWSHQIPAGWLKMQSAALDIPVIQQPASSENYETEMKKLLSSLKEEGITAGIFGDIDFEEHRTWVERVCRETGLTARLPLWGERQEKLVREFIDSGFETTIILTKADKLGHEWIGRKLDSAFINDLTEPGKTVCITPCGEAGEYHTLVTDGPLFKKSMEITGTTRYLEPGYWSLDISRLELRAKNA